MAGTSESNAPQIPALGIALSQLEGEYQTPAGQTVAPKERNPFERMDERVLSVLLGEGRGLVPRKDNSIEVKRLAGLNREEARGLMEYWAKSGMVREKVDGGFISEKWAISGGGVVGELERAVVAMRI